jgi:hypothetical protein
MMIKSENQLLSIDETCLLDLSEENESTISGGTFGLLSWIFGGLFGKPSYGYSQPSTGGSTGGYTIVNNNYNTIYVTTGGSSSGASAGSNSNSSSGGDKGW